MVEKAQDAADRIRRGRGGEGGGPDDPQIEDEIDEEMPEGGDEGGHQMQSWQGSGRSYMQCDIRKKHSRKGKEHCVAQSAMSQTNHVQPTHAERRWRDWLTPRCFKQLG